MFVSLFYSLRRVADEVKKWRPAGAERGYTFLKYNLSITCHLTNVLAHYGSFDVYHKLTWPYHY
ncbi:putative trichome birefringence-like family [Helianthus debilis subsp. tardiflorus]